MPTIKISDIVWNIKEVVLKPRENVGLTKKCGARLLIDEIALEEGNVYFKHSKLLEGSVQLKQSGSTLMNHIAPSMDHVELFFVALQVTVLVRSSAACRSQGPDLKDTMESRKKDDCEAMHVLEEVRKA
ncbi:hypothetical protein H0H81_002142 [Sphagnurus paluster]|uniref:Uncharacterized protein n=1 Tax=Sphagnurus paluster TaxID=117069 RepID=A0A9P7K1K4_9AGAR|nr:hypothetical protein H0H81_002142 [Sphagnurus paluster]